MMSPPSGIPWPSSWRWASPPRRPALAAGLPGVTLWTSTPLVGRQVERLSERVDRRAGDAEVGALDLAGLLELRDDLLGGVDRDREADADVAAVPLPPVSICELMPITRPAASSSGPPELPGLIAASVWMTLSIAKPLGAWIWRCSAETTPVVSVRSRPNGLPIAIVGSPTWTSLESPSVSGVSLRPLGSTFSSARSVEESLPTTLASTVFLSSNWTVTLRAPVDHVGVGEDVAVACRSTKPEPVASPCCSWGKRSNGDWTALDDLRPDVHDAGRVALVDVAPAVRPLPPVAIAGAGDRGLLDDRGRLAGPPPMPTTSRAAATTPPPSSTARERGTGERFMTRSVVGSVEAALKPRIKGCVEPKPARRSPGGAGQHRGRRPRRRGERISDSPTSTASTPTRSSSSSCSRVVKPDSETTVLPGRDVGEQVEGALDVDGEVAQVAVVDADHVGVDAPGRPRARPRRGPRPARRGRARAPPRAGAAGRAALERGDDQQDRVGARGRRLVDLVGVDDEVLAQDRQRSRPRAPRAGRRASRRSGRALGEDRQRRGAAALVGRRPRSTVAPARITPADGERRLCSAITEIPGGRAPRRTGGPRRARRERALELGQRDLRAAGDVLARATRRCGRGRSRRRQLAGAGDEALERRCRRAVVDRGLGGAATPSASESPPGPPA